MPRRPRLVPSGDIRDVVDLGIALQAIATEHNIHNVFDDGGYKELLLLQLFDLRKLYRVGDDARDRRGRRYEIKSVARVSSAGERKTSLNVTTEHTLTQANIDRYRTVYLWIVAIFNQSEPEAVYEVAPSELEPYFQRWQDKLLQMEQLAGPGSAPVHLNNPKIPLRYVVEHGVQVWPPRDVALPQTVREALDRTARLQGPG